MGQAAVDLPDPSEPAANSGNADDLLAQLAGEEVDRLLAEADLDEPAPPPAAATLPPANAINHADAPAPAVEAPKVGEANPAAEETRASELAAELEADEAIHGKSAGLSTTIAELAATNGHSTHAAPQAEQSEGPLPVYVRLLEVINSPLSLVPESMRDLVGKIALLTLFNAIAVIGYVLIFRKHH